MKFLSGVVAALLALSSWTWAWPACLAIAIAAFWHDLVGLLERVRMDQRTERLRRDLAAGWHVDADARTAFELLRR